jgi:hypothetical protein
MSGFSLAADEILKKQKTPITRIRVPLNGHSRYNQPMYMQTACFYRIRTI